MVVSYATRPLSVFGISRSAEKWVVGCNFFFLVVLSLSIHVIYFLLGYSDIFAILCRITRLTMTRSTSQYRDSGIGQPRPRTVTCH